jgi:hypothetical protein
VARGEGKFGANVTESMEEFVVDGTGIVEHGTMMPWTHLMPSLDKGGLVSLSGMNCALAP